MKTITFIFLFILFSLSAITQIIPGQESDYLSTNPDEGTFILPSESIIYHEYVLYPDNNNELPVPDVLRNYYNQNYYFSFYMPHNQDVDIHLKYPDNEEVMAGMLVYEDTEGEELNKITHFHESPGKMHINKHEFAPGNRVFVRLYFSDDMSEEKIEIAIRKRNPQGVPKQINVNTSTYTVQELITDVFITGCVQAFNISSNDGGNTYGDPLSTLSIGYFTDNIGNSGFDEGFVMTSGKAEQAEGPDNSPSSSFISGSGTDPDLQALIPGYSVNDACVLEFDFIPESNQVQFEYIFGSEEFPEWANSSYNDVFGFFLSGPGINGPYSNNAINIAKLPNGQPVTIDNLYNNQQYYEGATSGSGGTGDAYNNTIEYDGASIPLVAEADVQMCETYHIKLAIGDAGDSSYDSGVFFKASSFVSGLEYNVDSYNPWYQTTEVYEGCQTYVEFTRVDVSDLSQTINIGMQISGTATMGVDYSNIPNTYTIPAGQESSILEIDTYADGINEGPESIVFEYEMGCPCTPEIVYDTVWIYDELDPAINITNNGPICEGETATLTMDYSTSYDPDLIDWEWQINGSTGSEITVSPTTTTTYYIDVDYPCSSEVHSTTVTVNPNPDVDLGGDQAVCDYSTPVTLNAGSGMGEYDWSTGESTQTIQVSATDDYSVTVTDNNGCEGEDEMSLTVLVSPVVDLGPDQSACDYNTPITLDAGGGMDIYGWSTGDDTQTIDIDSTDTYAVTVTDGNGCTGDDSMVFTVNSSPDPDLGPDQTVCDYDTPVTLDAGGGMDIYNWSTGDDTQTIDVDSIDNYSVTVTDVNGCTGDDSMVLNVNPSPNPDLGPDQTICGYDTASVTLDAGPGTIYQWNITDTTQIITVVEGGMYAVTVTNHFGCTGADSMYLAIDQLPDPNLGSDTVLCDYNAPLTLDPGTDTSFNYHWSDGSGSSNLEVNESGTYSVTVIEGVCTAIDEIQVTINPSPSVDLGPDQYRCETEEPFLLDAGLGVTEYLWNTGNTSRTQDVTETGIYSVTVTNEYDCFDADSMYFQIDTMPPSGIFHDTNYCINADAVYLEAVAEGGTWEGPGIADQATGLFVPQVVGGNTTHITYTVVNGECTSVSETDIHVHALPDIQVINLQNVLCFGEATGEIHVTAPQSTSPEYDWVNHDMSGPYIHSLTAGVYNLVVTDAYSCQSDTFLIVSQPSELLVDYESGNPSCIGNNDGYIEFEVTGGVLPYLYRWERGESDSPLFNDLYEGKYNFVISDDHNCTEKVSIKLIDTPVECIRIPNAFTPNGDGTNDTWKIENLEMFSPYQVEVFNRWGQLLYFGTPGDESWDGRTLEGKKVPAGAYIYVINFDGGLDKRSGIVSVVY
jgi:gliding motility-associated-like protein